MEAKSKLYDRRRKSGIPGLPEFACSPWRRGQLKGFEPIQPVSVCPLCLHGTVARLPAGPFSNRVSCCSGGSSYQSLGNLDFPGISDTYEGLMVFFTRHFRPKGVTPAEQIYQLELAWAEAINTASAAPQNGITTNQIVEDFSTNFRATGLRTVTIPWLDNGNPSQTQTHEFKSWGAVRGAIVCPKRECTLYTDAGQLYVNHEAQSFSMYVLPP